MPKNDAPKADRPTKAHAEKSGQATIKKPFIVGVGASAGGVEAFQEFVSGLPEDAGIAWALIQHMAPDRESLLADILKRRASLPLEEVKDGTRARADHIYLIPPNTTLKIENGVFKVARTGRDAKRTPIDAFFLSLAADCSERCGCALLSGAGNDGTIGMKAVKEAGGVAFAQAQVDAQYDTMLMSAVNIGLVDRQMPAKELGNAFADFFRAAPEIARPDIDDEVRREIFDIVRTRTRHDFSDYKKKTVGRRIRRRIQAIGVETPEDYLAALKKQPEEADALLADMLISVTHFFRDPEAFRQLETTAISAIVREKTEDDTIRVWVPGCATGEEAYSIAMLLIEAVRGAQSPPKIQVFGSDIDERALQIARHGRYPLSIEADVTPERLKRFFEREDGTYRVREHVREVCLFASHNLLHDPPFSRVDLLSCRNLMIYLSSALQARLTPVLHYALKPGGYLFIGPAESIAGHTDRFVEVEKSHRIYRRVGQASRLPDFPISRAAAKGKSRAPLLTPAPVRQTRIEQGQDITLRRALEKYAPAYVLIDEHDEICEASAGTAPYMELPAGAPNLSLDHMIREDLRLELKVALSRAKATGRISSRTALRRSDHGEHGVNIIVESVPGLSDNGRRYLVVFERTEARVEKAGDESAGDDRDQLVEVLEQDLRLTRARLETATEELDTTNEELRASNEELSSVNEELKSSNEELETSKEELQSINEELRAVNRELKDRVDDLSRANSDLKNLFENTQVPVVFLDNELTIVSFTPPAKPLFNLRNHDAGRPLRELSSDIDCGDLEADARRVMDEDAVIEREVTTHDGETATYILRLRSYRNMEEEQKGVVLTLIDITERKRNEKHLATLVGELSHRVKNNLAAVIAIARQTRRDATDLNGFFRDFEARLQSMASAHRHLLDHSWKSADLASLAEDILQPFSGGGENHLSAEGPPVRIKPEKAITLAMILHELGVNAAKYGALSDGAGRVALTWKNDANSDVVLEWRETGGPKVSPPKKDGFGLTFIRQAGAHEFSGEPDLEFSENGFVCTLTLDQAALDGG